MTIIVRGVSKRCPLNLYWEGMGVSEDAIARLEEQIKTLFNDGQRRESTIKDLACDIKEIKEELANRLPIWATLAISSLMGLCGFLGAKAF